MPQLAASPQRNAESERLASVFVQDATPVKKWQATRDSNPQPSVLETEALPIELVTYSGRLSYGGQKKGSRGMGPGWAKSHPFPFV